MSDHRSYVPTPVQSGLADAQRLSAWLDNNEHQALELLFHTLKEYGYTKERVMAAFILYLDKRPYRT